MTALALAAIGGCGPPQMGMDKEAFKTVDALYTAVSLRDERQLDRCDRRLQELHTSGRVADGAYESLQGVIAKARGGSWESSGDDLRWFMKGQRKT